MESGSAPGRSSASAVSISTLQSTRLLARVRSHPPHPRRPSAAAGNKQKPLTSQRNAASPPDIFNNRSAWWARFALFRVCKHSPARTGTEEGAKKQKQSNWIESC